MGGALVAFALALFTIAFFVVIAIAGTSISYVIVNYGDEGIELGEKFLRCDAGPIWQDDVKPIINILRVLYNYVICWWNAINWGLYGLIREVLYPLLLECGIGDVVQEVFDLFIILVEDILGDYIATGAFLNQPFDQSRVCTQWNVVWTEWQSTGRCFCEDLADFYSAVPVLAGPTPVIPALVPVPFGFIFSSQIGDVETCNAFFGIFNAVQVVAQELFRIILEALTKALVNPSLIISRPDFRKAADFYCDAGKAYAKSFENIYQEAADGFSPLTINFDGLFRVIASTWCASGKAAVVGLDILINIDQVVQFPGNNYWMDPLQEDIAEVLNLIGQVNVPEFFMDVTQPQYPVFGEVTVVDGAATLVNYFLCDSTPPSICVDNGVNPDIFGPFTFDWVFCAIKEAVSFALDIIAGLVEFTYQFISTEEFFDFVDNGAYDIIDVLVEDVVRTVDCIATIFGFIPEIGYCLRQIITLSAELILKAASFLFKLITSIFTLPFLLVVVAPPRDNWLSDGDRALADWNELWDIVITNTTEPQPNTIANCITFILNYGIQFPPTPCTGTCIPTGFVEPDKKRMIQISPYELHKQTHVYGVHNMSYHPNPSKQIPTWQSFTDMFQKTADRPMGVFGIPQHSAFQDIDSFIERSYERAMYQKEDVSDFSHRIKKAKLWHQTISDDAIIRYQNPNASFPSVTINTWARNYTTLSAPRGVQSIKLGDGGVDITCTPLPGEAFVRCYDVACTIRKLLDLIATYARVIARAINGIAFGFEDGFAYFVDRIFEQDLFELIDVTFAPLSCTCNFLQLVFPIPNLDVCAPLFSAVDLVKGIIMTIINGSFAFALGRTPIVEVGSCSTIVECTAGFTCCTPGSFDDTGCLVPATTGDCVSEPFPYYTLQDFPNSDSNTFIQDINDLIDITIQITNDLCCILQAVLPIPGVNVCCFQERAIIAILEIIRWLLQTIVALATIFAGGEGYFRASNIDEVPFVVQADVVITSIFGEPGGTCDQGNGGLVLCICQFLNLIIPVRPDPAAPVMEGNCPSDTGVGLDPCCVIREVSFFIRETLRFAIRLLVTLFQEDPGTTLVEFFFCDENADPGDPLYSASCGKLQPAIDALFNLVTECPCQLFALLDEALSTNEFGNAGCFCGTSVGSSGRDGGILREIPQLVKVTLEKVLQLVRNFYMPDYWRNPPCPPSISTCTWSTFFFGPIADQACAAVGSIPCFITVIVPPLVPCQPTAETWIGGIVRWAFEAIIRTVDLIIGFVDTVSDSADCQSVSPTFNSDPTLASIDTDCLVSALNNILTLPVDILIADPYLDISGCPCPDDQVGPCAGCESDSNCACDLFRVPLCGESGLRVHGILIGALRYLACAAGRILGPGVGIAINSINILLSIIWQIYTRIIAVVINFILFFFSLFSLGQGDNCDCYPEETSPFLKGYVQGTGFGRGLCYPRCDAGDSLPSGFMCRSRCEGGADCTQPRGPKALCSFIQALSSFFDVLRSIIRIFVPPPQIPNVPAKKSVTSKKMTENHQKYQFRRDHSFYRHVFSEKVKSFKRGDVPFTTNATDGLTLLFDAVFDIEVTDCLGGDTNDFLICICRNYGPDLDGTVCHFDDTDEVFIPYIGVTSGQVTAEMSNLFVGVNPCAELVHHCGTVTWESVPYPEKFEYVNCLALHLKGERIHEVVDEFPSDFFHSDQGILNFMKNIGNSVQETAKKQAREAHLKMQKKRLEGPRDRVLDEKYVQGRGAQLRQDLRKHWGMRDKYIIERTIRMDQQERYLKSGAWEQRKREAWNNLLGGNLQLSKMVAAKNLFHSTWDLGSFVVGIPYLEHASNMANGMSMLAKDLDNAFIYTWKKGVRGMTRDMKKWNTPWKRVKEFWASEERMKGTQSEKIYNAYKRSMFYKWWNSPPTETQNPFRPFMEHVGRYMRDQSSEKNVHKSIFKRVVDGITETKSLFFQQFQWKWTEEKQRRWRKGLYPFVKIWHKLAPHKVSKEVHERFIIDGNCEVAERSIDLFLDLLFYCVNEFILNIPSRVSMSNRESMQSYMETIHEHGDINIMHRNGDFKPVIKWEKKHRHEDAFKRASFTKQSSRVRKMSRVRMSRLAPREFRRFITATPTFDWFNWILCRIDEWFGTMIAQTILDFVMDFTDFVLNTNIDPADCPDDVGLLYFVLFPIRCLFPENLNCANPCALGLSEALPYILLITLIIIVVAVIFPPISPIVGFLLIILWAVGLPGAAWHYSPACLLLTPAVPIFGGDGFGFPGVPFPVSLTFPECLLDDLVELADNVLNDCPLEPLAECNSTRGSGEVCLLPRCMYNSEVCLQCPERIDIAKCTQVGVAYGFDNLVFIANEYIPGFADFITVTLPGLCGSNGCIIPRSLLDWLVDLVNRYNTSSDTQDCRNRWCFWASILSIGLPLVVFTIAAVALFILLPAIVGFIIALIGFLIASPIPRAFIPGEGSEYFPANGSDEDELTREEAQSAIRRLERRAESQQSTSLINELFSPIGSLVRNTFTVHFKEKKE